ncbi:FitA-like ribbon-helix-helix domain-containing protein [Desulfonatronum parangueonense]
MATLTIRNLEEEIKQILCLKAARHGCSMEEEARRILRQACRASDIPGLGSRVADRFASLGGIELTKAERSLSRHPPNFLKDQPEWSC